MTSPINGIYVLQGIVPTQIAAAPVGVKVVDLYDDNNQLFSTSQVAQMESGGGLVLDYFSIGEAESYRSYFSSLPASVLGPVDPSWPGDYQVAYWTPAWMTVGGERVALLPEQQDGAGETVTRGMLFAGIWNYNFQLSPNLVDVHIGKLRRKLNGPGETDLLSSVKGAGFVLRRAVPDGQRGDGASPQAADRLSSSTSG